ncbi:MAG: hypothetical protein KBD10_00220 [Candidatus Pacebacteria bacterium]|nr:hypothetical protein [Candidatus Paceibacterota bacterium]
MSWGTHRRNTIIFIFFSIIFLITAYLLYDALYEPPNCFDKKWNGNEVNIDCGGSCSLMCESQVLKPIIHWTRVFEVAEGVYNVLAYVENPNPSAGVENVSYKFKVYDDQNVLIQERNGSTALLPKNFMPILENTLPVGRLDASRVTFEFTEPLVWHKQKIVDSLVSVQDEQLTRVEDEPRIRAIIKNNGIETINNLKIVAIVYDINNNAIAASGTLFKEAVVNKNLEAFFAWPAPFGAEVSRFELIPIYDRSSK